MLFFIFYLIIIYIICSFYEYVLHRYIMHGDPETLQNVPLIGFKLAHTARMHLDHHKSVNIDMTLKENKKSIKGVIFGWRLTFLLILIMGVTSKLLNLPSPIMIAVVTVLLHNLLWNNWHTRFHNYNYPANTTDGLPKLPNFPTPGQGIYSYLFKYHAIHHSQKGNKYNYNIIFPLFDHLFGTVSNDFCINNTKYCQQTDDDRCEQKQQHCFTEKDVHY